jgi:predicted anti-sigma-YlaC factor YlaD
VIHLLIRPRAELVCQQAVELVSDYLDGVLSRAQRRRFEVHLADCPDCPEYLAQMRATIALTGSISPDSLTPLIRNELIGLYRRYRAGGDLESHQDGSGPSDSTST